MTVPFIRSVHFYKRSAKLISMLDYPEVSRIVEAAAKSKVGRENIVRVFTAPGIDSDGKDALRITIVIAPGAADRIRGDDVLNMLVEMHNRLYEEHDERTPIIHYATEEELSVSDSSEC